MKELSDKNPIVHHNQLPLKANIISIRGQRVIIDSDLADLYGVKTKRLMNR